MTLQKYATFREGRGFEILLPSLGLMLAVSSVWIPEETFSVLGFSTLGKLRLAAKWTVLSCGVLSAFFGGISASIPTPRIKRIHSFLRFISGFFLAAGTLSWAAAGGRMDILGLTAQSIRLAAPIALGALSGILCERSGVINIGIEGMMLISACAGFTAALYTQSLWAGVFASVAGGTLAAGLHALLCIRYGADQIISGTVVNILAAGATGFVRSAFLLESPLQLPGVFPKIALPALSDIPVFGKALFDHQPLVFAMILLTALIHIGLFYTRWGLRSRAAGENPGAADAMGIDVVWIRYINIFASGAVAGLGGAWFSLEMVGNFELLMTGGKGFISLAAMIFGNWKPFGAFGGSLLFGFADALQIKIQITRPSIPYQFLSMAPYILTMGVLAGFVGKANAPSAVGMPYLPER